MRKYFTQSITILGTVTQKEPRTGIFTIRCRSEEEYLVHVSPFTHFQVLPHLDGSDRDRFPIPGNVYSSPEATLIQRYIFLDRLIYVQGILQEHQEQSRFEARMVILLQDVRGNFLFETNDWWLRQTICIADAWVANDTAQQKNNLAIGSNTIKVIELQNDHNLHSCTWLSRLIYGLSSSYLLTGKERYRLAAKNWITYQREYFQNVSHDRQYCFWGFDKLGQDTPSVSEAKEKNSGISLYEQICVLAGLSQYYRISQDPAVFEDIRRTITTFNKLFKDDTNRNQSYFSHLDYTTLSVEDNHLGQNKLRKNWHSNGEHIPAYLINLILVLDCLPTQINEAINEVYQNCLENLDAIALLLVEQFPDRDSKVPYINERFYYNWIPDHSWAWQQNRAIIGNNLRMAWTLCRVAIYYLTIVSKLEQAGKAEIAQQLSKKVARLINLAESLAMKMIPKGLDLLRGGVFDLVEREPKNGQPIEFAGSNTKDSWQQEQGILTYLMLYGITKKSVYLDIARELSAFWHVFCLSHNPIGVFFRVEADGRPTGIFSSSDMRSSDHYPLLEINYLGHIYTQLYSELRGQGNFCLYYKPNLNSTLNSINVLPDFVSPGTLEIKAYSINGIRKIPKNPQNFQIDLSHEKLGCELVVEFQTLR